MVTPRNGLTEYVTEAQIETNIPEKVIEILREFPDRRYTLRGLAIKIFGFNKSDLNVAHRDLNKDIGRQLGRLSNELRKLVEADAILKFPMVKTTVSPMRMNLYKIADGEFIY